MYTLDSQHFPFLSGVGAELLSAMNNALTTRDYAPGEVVFDQNTPAENLFFIFSGRASKEMIAGELIIGLGQVKTGYCVGWSSLEDDKHHQHKIVATSPCVIGMLPAATLRQLMDADPANAYPLMRRFFAIIKDRLELRTDQLVKVLADHPHLERLV